MEETVPQPSGDDDRTDEVEGSPIPDPEDEEETGPAEDDLPGAD
jgi:hypothetical protein